MCSSDLKLRFGDFHTITRAQTISDPTNQTRELWKLANSLLVNNYQSHAGGLRLLGMGVSGFEMNKQKQVDLFGNDVGERQSELDALSDSLHDRFGDAALHRAIELKRRSKLNQK